MEDPLSMEKEFLKANHRNLAAEHPGRYLLIKGEAVHGVFETYEQGVVAGATQFGAGPFLVRLVSRPEDPEAPSIPALALGVPFVAHS